MGRRMSDLNSPILTGFLLYGLFRGAGQIIRSVVALGGNQTLASGSADGSNGLIRFESAYRTGQDVVPA
jgi:hypothetical protein